jgi:hypothetical protein
VEACHGPARAAELVERGTDAFKKKYLKKVAGADSTPLPALRELRR